MHDRAALLILAYILLTGVVTGQEKAFAEPFAVKPSEVILPADVPLGKYRRTIQPFENWTLICDDNLENNQRICNISQIIADQTGSTVFSWSLVASEDGTPFMILRAPSDARDHGRISIAFSGRAEPVEVEIEGCSETVCVGTVPVGPILREQIAKNSTPTIEFLLASGKKVAVIAPLAGLTTALAAIH